MSSNRAPSRGRGRGRSSPTHHQPPPRQPQPPPPRHQFPPLSATAPPRQPPPHHQPPPRQQGPPPSHSAFPPLSSPAPPRHPQAPPPRQPQPPPPSHSASHQFPPLSSTAPPRQPQPQAQFPPLSSNAPRQPPPRQPQPPQPSHSASPPPPAADVAGPSSVSEDMEKMTITTAPAPEKVPPPTSSKAVKVLARPGFGTLGRKCVVKANHFLVQVADTDLTHYDVTITPEVTSKKVCRLIMQELVTCYRVSHLGKRQVAYDGGKSIYTAGELPFTSKDFAVKLDKDDNAKRDREFKVSIKFAAKPDLHHLRQFLNGRQLDSPQETVQALDVVLRSTPSINYTVIGRSFFETTLGDPGSLGGGVEYWKGYYQSLRPTQMGLSLNIDVSARPFFEPILVTEFVANCVGVRNLTRPLSDQDRLGIRKALKGIKVVLSPIGGVRRYKINGFTAEPLRQLTFTDDTGKTIFVPQYFYEKYKVKLSQTFLPAVQAGNSSKPIYLPMELCQIVSGQRYTKKLDERQVTNLLRATCQRPADRENSIRQMVRHNNYSNDAVVNDFGIQVNCELTSVEARVLPPPQLQYRDALENPQVGSWNMINKKMVDGGTVNFWACVNFSRLRQNEVGDFCQALVRMCNEKGMSFNPNNILPHYHINNASQIESTLVNIQKDSSARIAEVGHAGKQLQLLIVILPGDSDQYGKIKRICETELGIVTQCVRPNQKKLVSMQYLENLSLKINVKVGGRNNVLLNAIKNRIPNLTDRPTIIFGADVTHPPPGEDSSPSIAAVVASMDWPQVTKFRALVSAQTHRDEIIHDLYTCTRDGEKILSHGGLIREHLIAFFKSTKMKPHRIIFYRDGVSDGQFNQVLLYEVDAIRKACESLEAGYQPRITFSVVQKRHHTRLFPVNPRDRSSVDRSGNILPGTVIDTNICHPTEFDFYLCSHAGIQGTSRPAHYQVLYDENGFTADQFQSLTNNLCYTYARCTRSVSVVPPAYYAHLAAFRARYYMAGGIGVSQSESSGGAGAATRDRAVDVRALPAIKDNVKEVMFYC